MAYQPMFNVGGGYNPMNLFESEEERRRREQQEAIARGEIPAAPVAPAEPTPIKQTITIDPVTGQQKMKLEGSVEDLSAANPLTPTVSMPGQVAGPMAPTSGPSPEELLREQEQRRQYELMMAQPPAAPVAPPQAPVQMAAAAPTTRTDVTAPITGPVPPTAPMMAPPAPDQQYEAQGMQEGPVQQQAVTDMNWSNIIAAAHRDPAAMERIAQDPNTPENWRRVAAAQAGDIMKSEKALQRAEIKGDRMLETGRGLSEAISRKTEDVNYLKQYLLRRLGMQKEADQELAKGAYSYQNVVGTDNKPYTVKLRNDGMPLAAYDAEGNPVDSKTLSSLASEAIMQKGATHATATRVRDTNGVEWSQVPTARGMVFYDNTGKRGTPAGKTVPIGIGSDLDLAFQREAMQARIKLESLKAGERIKNLETLNATRLKEGKAPLSLDDVGLDRSGEFTTRGAVSTQAVSPQFGGQAVPGAAAPAAPAAPAARAPVAPAAGPAAPAAAPETTGAIERTAEARKEIVKKSADVVANAAQIINDIESGNTALNILENKPTNFGSILQGQIPGEQSVGRFFGTEEARDTQTVMEVVDRVTASGAKALGANPTDRDLQFLLNNRPNESWPPQRVSDWIRRVQERSRVALDVAKKQVESGGAFVPEAPTSTPRGRSTAPAAGPAVNTEKTYQGRTYIFDGRGWKEKR